MKKLVTRKDSGGIFLVLAILLGLASALGAIGYPIYHSFAYNRLHLIAREVADDPNSHSKEEITNAGTEFLNMVKDGVESGSGPNTAPSLGGKLIVQAEEALRRVRAQEYVVKIGINPAQPVPCHPVTVHVEVLNSMTGTPVHYSVVGTDGVKFGGILPTDGNGRISFNAPGSWQGASHTIRVTVGSVSKPYTYTFPVNPADVDEEPAQE